jgi:RimJ/RimL family protein N-acetyltransferase
MEEIVMSTMPSLETVRLIIRPFSGDDLQAIHHILDVELADVEVGNAGAATLLQRAEWLQWTVLNYAQLGRLYQPPYGDRAMVRKATGELIGACGFVPSFGPFSQLPAFAALGADGQAQLNTPEFGLFYAVSLAFQRQGYAAEATRALIDYAFHHLHLRRIVATTTYENTASIRVMEKVGMQIERNPYPEPSWFQIVGILENRAAGSHPRAL